MTNFNEMPISKIKELVLERFSEEKAKEILSLSPDEIISVLENEEDSIIDKEDVVCIKHIPSRKKKANRKRKVTTAYKRKRERKWIEKRRTNIPNEDTVSRSYLDKSTKKYNKLIPHVKPKSKKTDEEKVEEKKS